MLTLAQYSYERFWYLAQAAYMAEVERTYGDRAMGYSNALQACLQDSIAFDMDTCVTLITQRRDGIAPEMTGVPDPYRDGYIAACNRALDIITGRL